MKRAAALVACILQATAACSDPVSHILSGRLYLAARACLGTSSSVDVVSGPDPGTCAPACIVQTSAEDGGRTLFVTTTCGPYTPDYDTTGKDPSCAPALAAFSRDDTCLSDGGSTNPIAPPPPPPPADAGPD